MPPKPPRRTRERILQTALAMFNQFGELTVATTSIAFEMGISPGNLYYHYPSKDAIVADLFAEFRREIETTLAAPEQRLPNAEDCWLFLGRPNRIARGGGRVGARHFAVRMSRPRSTV